VDVLSLFAAVVALTLFPGGVYAVAVAAGAATGGRLPAGAAAWTSANLAAAVLLLTGVALVPLPDAPSATLPVDTGAPANLLAALILVGGSVALGSAPAWSRARGIAAAAAVVPLLVLAAAAATLSLPVVVALPGRELASARALAAVALLLAAPVLGRPHDPAVPRGLRALLLAVPALLAAVLLAPPGWSNLPGALVAAMVLAGVGLYAGVIGTVGRLLRGRELPLAAAAALAAIASITLAALASR
jgi:hypothetical protein